MPKLYPYQEEGVEFLLSKKRAGLFDAPGLGKSAQAITACRRLKAKRVLIVCPASLRLNWAKEWQLWGDRSVVPVIVSYNYIQKIKGVKGRWCCVIADEASALSKWTARQTLNFVKLIAPKAGRLYLLTGTPSTQAASDLHPLLSMLEPGRHGKFKDFRERHCNLRTVGFGRYAREVWDGYRNTELLNVAIKRVSIRRTVEEVLPELPQKRFSTLYVDVDCPRITQEELDEAIEAGKPPPSLLPMLQDLGLSKAKEAAEYLQSLTEPVVVFCYFHSTVDYLVQTALKGKRVECMTGRESAAKKEIAKAAFQAGFVDYLLVNFLSGGLGHTLHKAALCVFIEFPYSPALYAQAYSRLTRIGQTKKVNIVNVIAKGTYDDRLLKILRTKTRGIKECLEA